MYPHIPASRINNNLWVLLRLTIKGDTSILATNTTELFSARPKAAIILQKYINECNYKHVTK